MMNKTADVVIIGGGISGATIAYYLTKKGVQNVILIEKDYIAGGATGRCGAGIRQQWGTRMNCLVARYSCEAFEGAQEELGYEHDIEFKQSGYLLLASSEKEALQFRKNVSLQNSLGIQSRLLDNDEAKEVVPFLNTDRIVQCAFHHKDGHLNPFHTTQAYINAARRNGAEIMTHTTVTGIKTQGGKITLVETSRGNISSPVVVNAAGGWSQQIAEMVGVNLPLYSKRHEILITEPLDPILKPMVISFSLNFYCQQVPHGGFIMGSGDENAPRDLRQNSSWEFLEGISKTVIEVLPPLRNARVLRQWAGLYNMSPDKQPIYGPVDGTDGFFVACGFSGHGFMFGPATGLIISEYILGEQLTLPVEALTLSRFAEGNLIMEPSVV
jgi:sarcosine oxidase subunit beta